MALMKKAKNKMASKSDIANKDRKDCIESSAFYRKCIYSFILLLMRNVKADVVLGSTDFLCKQACLRGIESILQKNTGVFDAIQKVTSDNCFRSFELCGLF